MEVDHLDGEKPQPSDKRKRGFFRLLSDVRVFTVVVCLYTMISFMIEAYSVAVITTIEKRFGFRSTSSGMLFTFKEIAYVGIVAVSAYVGNRWHIPRYLALMGVLCAFGTALSSLPHFIYGSPNDMFVNLTDVNSTAGSKTRKLCQSGVLESLAGGSGNTSQPIGECNGGDNKQLVHNDGAYALFATSQFIVGLALAPLVACTTTYMDDAVGPVKNSIYLAFLVMVRPLGPVFAFLVGSLFTSYHESLGDPGYGPTDPRWMGAWWIGYLLNPCLMLLGAILIAPFPKTMQKEGVKQQMIEMTIIRPQIEKEETKNVMIDILRALGRIFCNPIFMTLMTAGCFSSFVAAGMFPFMPKYLEVHFAISASKANLLVGTLGAVTAGVGALLGGILPSRLKWRPSQSARFILLTNILFTITMTIMMLISCPTVTYAGINGPTNETCRSTCGCEMNEFDPVCGSDGLTYISPCVAGCQQSYSNETLGDCTCIDGAHTAVPGTCDSECRMWILYIAVMGVGAVIGMMAVVPGTTVCLRCVEERDRTLALGVVGTIVSLVAFLPGGVVFGLLIDSACVLWAESCTNSGSCRIYDKEQFRYRFHGVILILKVMAGLFYFVVCVLVHREEKKLTFTKVKTDEDDAVEKLSDEPSKLL